MTQSSSIYIAGLFVLSTILLMLIVGFIIYRVGRGRAKPLIGRITSEADAQSVAGIWMISCIDENPGLTYASAASRLQIDGEKVKKIVADWRELFRPGIGDKDNVFSSQDNNVKKRAETLQRLSREQLKKEEGLTQDKRSELEKKIESCDLQDWCFRSQFRRSLSQERSPAAEIQVGLDYIETQRKSCLEFAEKTRQERIYMAPVWSIILTLLVGIIALGANFYVGMQANRLKKLEIKMTKVAPMQSELAKPSSPSPTSSPPAR